MNTTHVFIGILLLLLLSCQKPPESIHLPAELMPGGDSTIFIGVEYQEVRRRRELQKNEDRSEYTSSVYYEKMPADSLFTGIAYRSSGRYLSAVTFSRDVDNQDVALDSLVKWLVEVLQRQYGKEFAVYERQQGHIVAPKLVWRTENGGYVSLLYIPYTLVQEQQKKYALVFNHLILSITHEKDPWMKETQRFSKKALGLDAL